ncbi:MAG: ABC transporter ATP-binding protein [Spirochaetales bacterium]|uniref:ABC transporter ATP-binding protein n=1 Tax=Bullifex sp. TaxID=2815808 RepID=UPI002A4EAEEB|nr:ABC transporter ATP-binding protein [Bullifex sp.]MDD7271489.1 ABC transporter ATP-binding protein [Spirochaetales bacterium]MDY4067118.1 ABC transporter ATP-binding protein [Bullifex sp.]
MAKIKKLPPQKAKDPKKTFKRLFSEVFGENKLKLTVVIICIIISALSTVYISTLLKTLIDDFITPIVKSGTFDFSPLLKAMCGWALIMLLGVTTTYLQGRIMVKIAQDALLNIRNKMFAKLERLPISYFDTHQHGQIMSRFTNDADTLQQMISQSIVSVISSGLTLICVFIALLMNSWILTILIVLTVIVLMNVTKIIGSKSSKNFALQQKNLAKVNGYIEEMMNGSKVVKVFNHEDASKKEFDQINNELCQTMTRANTYSNVMGPVVNNIGNLQYVILVFAGSLISIVTGGSYSVGSLAAFLQLSKSFTNPLGQIAQQVNFFLMALAGAERIFELLDEEEEVDNGYVTLVNAKEENGVLTECKERTGIWAWKHPHTDGSGITYTKLRGDIVMSEVDFSYVEGKPVLKDVSLYAHPGEKIAFVGATGAGKTTITNLLNRFYDIQDGKIRFDGININKIKKSDLRHSLGIILQDTHLFSGTIKDNIRYGKLDATDEEIINAAKLANAHEFIMMMKDGYDTMLENDGEGLSQGQRQLIAIARAAVANPPVLVMDEATSSIDTHTESLVQEGMDRLMEGRTVFVIAHRLSTVRNSDCIMVLDHGSIIERGTHDSLIAEKGVYYRLYTGAFELS